MADLLRYGKHHQPLHPRDVRRNQANRWCPEIDILSIYLVLFDSPRMRAVV